jgi:AraC-like DNA-binding protein/tetratricopeptide (TPR) repeat protein
MPHPRSKALDVQQLWNVARNGDYRAGAVAARDAIGRQAAGSIKRRVELHLIIAFCAMRQGHHADALRALDEGTQLVAPRPSIRKMQLRIDVWRAELAYYQGRYSDANRAIDRVLPELERQRDWALVAFALRIRIAILLALADYEQATRLADRAIEAAEAGEDDYVLVQVLNVLGAVEFDRATSKLKTPHARAHLSSLDHADALPLEADARKALHYFERARDVAKRGRYEFAAWYVAGNIERLEILLGRAERAIRPIRRRLRILQARGATYDEIVARSNLAWGLRTLGRYSEAAHELDVALRLAREGGTANVLLEFLEYDRSIVLDALGNGIEARASYRRYLRLIGVSGAQPDTAAPAPTAPSRPLEPYLLKRADRFISSHLGVRFTVAQLAAHCGVSWRTLDKLFSDFRGVTPVAHVRNVRLDQAHNVLAGTPVSIAEVAAAFGFRSITTFALEYRKRFGVPPSQTVHAGSRGEA